MRGPPTFIPMLFNVQVLRALASVLVVHAHTAGSLHLSWVGGHNGVDLFFVISGFIIAYVASTDASQFMTRRLIRIVPIYWASTLAIFALVNLVPHLFRTTSNDPILLLKSLVFVPDGSGVHTEDGVPHPTLNGGWTLNYEMYFYVVYWIALALSRRWASQIAIAIIGAVIAIVQLTPLDDIPEAHFYGYPIVIEFVFGVIAYQLVVVAGRRPHRPRRAIKVGLFAVIVAGLVLLAFSREIFGTAPRYFASGIPAFFVVLATVLLEKLYGVRVTSRLLVAIGDASYVLYLLHAYIVFGIVRLAIGNRTFSEPVGQLIVLALIALSAAIAIAVYRWFEVPVLRWLKRRLLKTKPR